MCSTVSFRKFFHVPGCGPTAPSRNVPVDIRPPLETSTGKLDRAERLAVDRTAQIHARLAKSKATDSLCRMGTTPEDRGVGTRGRKKGAGRQKDCCLMQPFLPLRPAAVPLVWSRYLTNSISR